MGVNHLKFIHRTKTSLIIAFLICGQFLSAQKKLELNDLSNFRNPAANWHIAGDVYADINKSHTMTFNPGVGILVNLPNPSAAHEDLFTNFKHGDVDIELDCMMAKESNSGIYLQGRYELQLLDSWGVLTPRSSDIGGIYERYDNSRPEGQRNIDGHAPRQNASKAPGLWQHFKISFQAPKFQGGVKVKNAKILSVELNGVLVQENIELYAPTAGSVDENEVASDALRIQGDHGQVAFKNIVVTNFDNALPALSGITYSIYKGKFENEPDFKSLKPVLERKGTVITTNIDGLANNEFLLRYTGFLQVNESGKYNFSLNTSGGTGSLKINNNQIIKFGKGDRDAQIDLQSGNQPFELIYSKYEDWQKASLVLKAEGPGIREFVMSDASNLPVDDVNPVYVNASENTILRSFIDLPDTKRVVHAVNVGTPQKVHYTYDLDNGTIVQAWRGEFLDATAMWIDRGDGSSKPRGAVTYFGKPRFALNKLNSSNAEWASDTASTGYIPKGYVLDDQDRPSFKYKIYGAMVTDAVKVLQNGQGIQREINIEKGVENLYICLVNAGKIEEVASGLFIIDDKKYYIKIEGDAGAKPLIREQKGRLELIAPVQGKFTYSILF